MDNPNGFYYFCSLPLYNVEQNKYFTAESLRRREKHTMLLVEPLTHHQNSASLCLCGEMLLSF